MATVEAMATVRRWATVPECMAMSLVTVVTLFGTPIAYNADWGRCLIGRQLAPTLGGELWTGRAAAGSKTDAPGNRVNEPSLNLTQPPAPTDDTATVLAMSTSKTIHAKMSRTSI